MLTTLRRLIRRDLCACGHERSEHWHPFDRGTACTRCLCAGYRKAGT